MYCVYICLRDVYTGMYTQGMYTCTHVCTRVCMHARVHICAHRWVHSCMYDSKRAHSWKYTMDRSNSELCRREVASPLTLYMCSINIAYWVDSGVNIEDKQDAHTCIDKDTATLCTNVDVCANIVSASKRAKHHAVTIYRYAYSTHVRTCAHTRTPQPHAHTYMMYISLWREYMSQNCLEVQREECT